MSTSRLTLIFSHACPGGPSRGKGWHVKWGPGKPTAHQPEEFDCNMTMSLASLTPTRTCMCCNEAKQGASACTHWHHAVHKHRQRPLPVHGLPAPAPTLRAHSGQARTSNSQPELRFSKVHGCMAAGTAQKHGCHSTPGDKNLLPSNTACISHETIRCTTGHTGAHRSWICVRTGAHGAYQCRECASSQPTTGILSGAPHRHPRRNTSVLRTQHFIRCHSLLSSAPAHTSAGAAGADRLGGQHSGTRSEPRAAAGLHPAQARPWYPYRRFDAPQPCVWCALSSCTGSAVVLLDGAHAAEAGHAGVHAQPGQRNVRAPAARACWLSTGLGQYAVQPRMRVAGRGALQGMLSQAQVGKGCPSRAA